MPDDVFDQIPLFQGLSPEQLNVLKPLFAPLDCHAGTVLFEQGEPALYLYLVVSGEAIIRYKPEDGQDITIARVRPGGIVGWSAVIGRRFYTSAAVCMQYSQMLRVRGSDLQALCEQKPDTGVIILERLANVIGERITATHPEVKAILENGLRNGMYHPGG
jgi:CRP-like cAMP-binding protein